MKSLFIFAAWVVVGVLLVVVGIGGWQYYQHQLDPGDDQPSFQTGTDTNHDTVAAKPVDGDVRSGNATAARIAKRRFRRSISLLPPHRRPGRIASGAPPSPSPQWTASRGSGSTTPRCL